MKYRLPKGCAGVSHAGRALAIAPDGTVDVEPGAAVLLAPHGLVPATEPADLKPVESKRIDPKPIDPKPIDPKPIDPKRVDMLSRAELVAGLTARGAPAPAGADIATLRGALRQALARSK